jgi:hypothetical protein
MHTTLRPDSHNLAENQAAAPILAQVVSIEGAGCVELRVSWSLLRMLLPLGNMAGVRSMRPRWRPCPISR